MSICPGVFHGLLFEIERSVQIEHDLLHFVLVVVGEQGVDGVQVAGFLPHPSGQHPGGLYLAHLHVVGDGHLAAVHHSVVVVVCVQHPVVSCLVRGSAAWKVNLKLSWLSSIRDGSIAVYHHVPEQWAVSFSYIERNDGHIDHPDCVVSIEGVVGQDTASVGVTEWELLVGEPLAHVPRYIEPLHYVRCGTQLSLCEHLTLDTAQGHHQGKGQGRDHCV